MPSDHAAKPDPAVAERPAGVPAGFEAVEVCDLCGSSETVELVAETPARCRTVLCRQCGLMFASPRMSEERLRDFYDDEFTGDLGSAARLAITPRGDGRLRREDWLARKWALPLVKRHLDPKGATILDMRCWTGALSASLVREGARVLSVDPFAASLDIAREERGLSDLFLVPVTEFETLALPEAGSVDAVVALNVHVLAHLRSPRRWLRRMHELLRPGGHLILDEKDVLLPVNQRGSSVFDSGQAHNYHLTLTTLRKYALDAGFELVECGIDPYRRTAFRHMVLVARKPAQPGQAAAPGKADAGAALRNPADAAAIAARLDRLHRTWALRRLGMRLRRELRQGRLAVVRKARALRAGGGLPIFPARPKG